MILEKLDTVMKSKIVLLLLYQQLFLTSGHFIMLFKLKFSGWGRGVREAYSHRISSLSVCAY